MAEARQRALWPSAFHDVACCTTRVRLSTVLRRGPPCPALCVLRVTIDIKCVTAACQWRSFKFDPSGAQDLRRRTGIIPGNRSNTRIKPLPLTNGHGRHTTVAPERTLFSVGEWPLHTTVINLKQFHFRNGYVTAVSLLTPPCGGFRSETATWIQKRKIPLGTSRTLYV